MSAYIVDNETINKIVSYLYAKAVGGDTSSVLLELVKIGWDLSNNQDHAERLANAMFDLNVAAVQARYEGAEEEWYPLPSFKYQFTPASQIEAIKALKTWKYQCTEGYIPTTKLYKAMTEVHCLLCVDFVEQTEEYEAAQWE
jgi:hypothetical protein